MYNQIARLAREVQNEADTMANIEALEEGKEYIPLQQSSFVLYLPGGNNNNNYALQDRRLDVALLRDIVSLKRCARRAYVVSKLTRGRRVLEEEYVVAERSARARAAKSRREHNLTLRTCTAVLPHLRDRPNLYHQVSSHISMLIDCNGSKSSSSCSDSRGRSAKKSWFNNDDDLSSSDCSSLSGSLSSSQELWKDVQRLDELIDFMTDGTFVKSAFQQMKQTIEVEAKALQKQEMDQLDSDQVLIGDYRQHHAKLDAVFDDVPDLLQIE